MIRKGLLAECDFCLASQFSPGDRPAAARILVHSGWTLRFSGPLAGGNRATCPQCRIYRELRGLRVLMPAHIVPKEDER